MTKGKFWFAVITFGQEKTKLKIQQITAPTFKATLWQFLYWWGIGPGVVVVVAHVVVIAHLFLCHLLALLKILLAR